MTSTPAVPIAPAHRGFALLELLVAVAIFAMVASLAWGGLDAIVRSRRVLDDEATQLARLQRAVGRFDRDVTAALPRPIRDERGQLQPALAGDAQRVDVSTWSSVGGSVAHPSLRRVSWNCANDQLRRTQWAAPDRTAATAKQEQVFLDKVTDCRLRYLAQDGTASEHWPLREMPANALPRGVEIGFRLDTHGRFLRTLELVQAAETVR
jgi:general secretion pathway protein J